MNEHPCPPSAQRPGHGAGPARIVAVLLAAGVTAGLTACGPSPAPAPAPAPAGTAPPPVEVGVVTVEPTRVGLVSELPGRTEASRVAQVRARAAGILLRQQFREGSDVRAGQPLFQIDDAPYRATLASAQATLARAEANRLQTQAQAERYRPLAAAQAVSQQEYVAAQAAYQQAQADVAAAQAAIQTAQLNLGYASVTAPIAGRIGRPLVTEGALVGQGEATPLAIVQQIDPLFVNVTQPAAEAMRLRRALESGQLARAPGSSAAAVRIVLEDGSVHPIAGRWLSSDLTVDASTGQVTLRAELPNPKGVLLPGLYVRVRFEPAEAPRAILLPQQAVTLNASGASVLVVADGKASPRNVQVGNAQAGQWVILGGLNAGEQVIVDGFQKLRPGATLKPVPWQPARPGGAPASAASAAPSAASR